MASINRGPLAMGLLTGKYDAASRLPAGDVRVPAGQPWVGYFADGRPAPEWLARLEAIRDVLASGGRTLAQGAPGLAAGPQPPYRADPGHPDRRPGRAERGGAASRPAAVGTRWPRSPSC